MKGIKIIWLDEPNESVFVLAIMIIMLIYLGIPAAIGLVPEWIFWGWFAILFICLTISQIKIERVKWKKLKTKKKK